MAIQKQQFVTVVDAFRCNDNDDVLIKFDRNISVDVVMNIDGVTNDYCEFIKKENVSEINWIVIPYFLVTSFNNIVPICRVDDDITIKAIVISDLINAKMVIDIDDEYYNTIDVINIDEYQRKLTNDKFIKFTFNMFNI